MRPVLPLIPWLLVLSSCSSPPKPPSVDESNRRPANTAMAVDLQVCRNDLQNTRILASESGRLAESTAATLERMAARQQALAAMQAAMQSAVAPIPEAQALARPAAPPAPNRIFTVRFDFGSIRVAIPPTDARALIDAARTAPLVLLRGRTDGRTDALPESRVARERADAVRDYLVAAGVDPARIRATYQPVGDHVADNSSPAGRGLNRRVEIEVYRVLPVAMGTTTVALP